MDERRAACPYEYDSSSFPPYFAAVAKEETSATMGNFTIAPWRWSPQHESRHKPFVASRGFQIKTGGGSAGSPGGVAAIRAIVNASVRGNDPCGLHNIMGRGTRVNNQYNQHVRSRAPMGPRRTSLSIAIAMSVALLVPAYAWAQQATPTAADNQGADQATPSKAATRKAKADEKKAATQLGTVVVTGIRASVEKAQDIKRDANTFVDSVSATDIGALPDRSVTETLSRIPGVTIDHFLSQGDPEHFSAEGHGVQVRGLTQVRSEINGGDSFSANGGRALGFQDVPS
ncbi:MAG: TonB-dependent receptor plug domain-containing protein, partial [Rhodanobacter sp.]